MPNGQRRSAPNSTGTSPNTTYHLRLAAENGGGADIKEAADTFTTLPPGSPIFTIDPATVGYTTAEVSGTVNPEGGDIATETFWNGASNSRTEPGNPSSWTYSQCRGILRTVPEEVPIPVGGTITGLKPGTTYYFRMSRTTTFDIRY